MQLSKYQIRGVIRFLCVELEKADENCNCNFLYFGLVNSDNLRFIVEMTTKYRYSNILFLTMKCTTKYECNNP